MHALVKEHSAAGLTLKRVPVPEIGINDVLIRVDRTGICGTDVHIYKWDAWAQKTMLARMSPTSIRVKWSVVKDMWFVVVVETVSPDDAISARILKGSALIGLGHLPNTFRFP